MPSMEMKTDMGRGPIGFTPLWNTDIPYMGLAVHAFRHRSGIEVICMQCNDLENVFIAGFRTENLDDTGVQHCVEHVVLGGSRNYRVKSPCEEMGRGSLATYINAETYLDRTLYPYASINADEFRNGVEIYLDAVFNPLLKREAFMQEAWRYELQYSEGQRRPTGLKTTGIVLNERRAQMNDISDLALDAAYHELLKGHPLSYDSGGTPGVIETLSYEAFLAYYQSHYALNKAKLLFYGNIPEETKLQWVDDYLERNCKDRMEVMPVAQMQCEAPKEIPWWTRPRMVTRSVAADDGGDCGCSWSLNWRLGRLEGKDEALGMELLTVLLMEDDSSPLRQALLESGLCDDLLDCSDYETEHSECLFVVGVVNCKTDDFVKLRRICMSCLKRCAENGFSDATVTAAMNQMRLRYQDVSSEYGLSLGRLVMRNWLSGLAPVTGLDYRKGMTSLKNRIDDEPDFLRQLLQEKLLGNAHRVELRFVPDVHEGRRRRKAEGERLQKLLAEMNETRIHELEQEKKAFDAYQKLEDAPEDLESFPRLERSQLPDNPFNPTVERLVLPSGTVVLKGGNGGCGINYVKLAFGAGLFPKAEQKLIPIAACLLDGVGTFGQPFEELEQKLAAAGAELDVDSLLGGNDRVTGKPQLVLTMKLSALEEHWTEALECLEAKWHRSVLTEKKHIGDILTQCWSQAQQKMVSEDEALEMAMGRSAAGLGGREDCYEHGYGVCGMRILRKVMKSLAEGTGTTRALLEKMTGRISAALPGIVSYSGNEEGFARLMDMLNQCSSGKMGTATVEMQPVKPERGRFEGMTNGRREFCCVRSFKVFGYENALWAAMDVYSELLSEGFLQEEIRLSGGAYGGGCSYNPGSGVLQMYSYRDPNPKETLAVFAAAAGRMEKWSEKQITGAIAGCIRNDVPLHAAESCNVALARELMALSDEERAQRRKHLLSVTLEDIRKAAECLGKAAGEGWNDCLVGERRTIEKLGGTLIGWK